jgi:hypothetical protein
MEIKAGPSKGKLEICSKYLEEELREIWYVDIKV